MSIDTIEAIATPSKDAALAFRIASMSDARLNNRKRRWRYGYGQMGHRNGHITLFRRRDQVFRYIGPNDG